MPMDESPSGPGEQPPRKPDAGATNVPPADEAKASPPTAKAMEMVARLPLWTVPAVFAGVVALAWALSAAIPGFFENIIWKYYWGPIKADAEGAVCQPFNGTGALACSGYNVVNTASWAVLLALCILFVLQLLQRLQAKMDNRLIVGAAGWVAAGSVFHVLEDTGLFRAPLQYFFITPPIYLLFAAIAILTFVIGHYLALVARNVSVERALQKLWLILAVPVLLYVVLWAQGWDQIVRYVNPVWVALFALIAYVPAAWRFRAIRRIEPNELVAFMSIGWILLSLAYVAEYVRNRWGTRIPAPVPPALLAPVIAAAVVGLVWVVARAFHARKPRAVTAAFLIPINLFLLFSQLLDGFATSIGIDLGGAYGADYSEKHVLSGGVIGWTKNLGDSLHWPLLSQYPTFFGFATLKLLLSLLIIYAIDGANPEDARRSPNLIGLVKFAIIMVGFGPGIRDFTRMALGI